MGVTRIPLVNAPANYIFCFQTAIIGDFASEVGWFASWLHKMKTEESDA